MTKMTSAYANKVLNKLTNDKEFWLQKENDGKLYRATIDEEPVIPDYDYEKVQAEIARIDMQIMKIKHSINVANSTNKIPVGDSEMTVDMILIRMPQLNRRLAILDSMRKHQPKTRITDVFYTTKSKPSPEYEYINYELEKVQADYDTISSQIALMQLALDKYNQTVEFDVDYDA